MGGFCDGRGRGEELGILVFGFNLSWPAPIWAIPLWPKQSEIFCCRKKRSVNCVWKLESDCPRVSGALATEAVSPLGVSHQIGGSRPKNVRFGLVWAQTTGRMTRGHIKARRQRANQNQGEEEDGESPQMSNLMQSFRKDVLQSNKRGCFAHC